MRKILILLFLGHFAFSQSVNAIIGDRSWVDTFGETNLRQAKEKDRIKTHLNYVISLLSLNEKNKIESPQRELMLKLLQRYVDSAVFPKSFSYSSAERRPCFIDDKGILCAVGYLIANTAGHKEAQRINSKFRFDYLLDIKDESFMAWQKQSGLSLEELAMIQPSYRVPEPNRRIRESYIYLDQERQLFGLKDTRNGKILLKPKYEQLHMAKDLDFVMGLKNEAWYLLNLKGEKQSRHDYSKIIFLEDSLLKLALASTESGKLYIYSDSLGLISKHKNSTLHAVFKDLFVLKSDDSLTVWKKGKERLSLPSFSDISLIYRLPGTAPVLQVENKDQFGLYTLEGKIISPIKWLKISTQKGLYVGQLEAEEFLIHPDGTEWRYPENKSPFETHNDRSLILETEAGIGLFDSKKMDWLITPQFKEISLLAQYNFYEVKTDKHRGYYDYLGKELVPPIYEYSRPYAECIMVQKEGQMGLINRINQAVIPLVFDTLSFGIWPADSDDYRKLFYKTKKNGKLQVWTSAGEEVALPKNSKELYSLGSHICLLKTSEGMRVVLSKNQALVNHSNLLIDTGYTIGFKGLIYFKNQKWGFYRIPSGSNLGPPEIGPAIYDTIIYRVTSDRDRFMVQKDGFWGLYSFSKDTLIESATHDAFYPIDLGNRMERIFFYTNKKWHQNHLGKSIPPLEEPYNRKLSQKFNAQREQLKAYWISEIPMQ